MGGIGFDEILVVLLISILVFGKDLPKVARRAGMYLRRARRYLLDIKEDIERQIPMDDLELGDDDWRPLDQDKGAPPNKPLPYIPETDSTNGDPKSQEEIPEEWKEELPADTGPSDPPQEGPAPKA